MSKYQKYYLNREYQNQGFPALVDLVLNEHHLILDVGSGDGANLVLLTKRGHEAVGLTLSEIEAHTIRNKGLSCVVCDISEVELPFPEQSFDAVLFSHVLEHLPWPEEVLTRYLKLVRPGGGIYIALPNVLNIAQRWQFFHGQFKYQETGVMDRTHLRFFDFESARNLAESVGIRVIHHFGIGQCPLGPLRKTFPILCQKIDKWTTKQWPGLFSFHIVIIGKAK